MITLRFTNCLTTCSDFACLCIDFNLNNLKHFLKASRQHRKIYFPKKLLMGDVILITGGCGFLAQHLIRELQEASAKGWQIKEIRVADKRIYRKFLDYENNVPVHEHIVDCSSEKELATIMAGVTVVFNLCARRYPLDMYQNYEKMMQDNFYSVKRVVEVMKRFNVEWLIHVSDAFVCLGNQDAQAPTEMGTLKPPPAGFLLGTYGETKFKGEVVAREANGSTLDNGSKLHTVILRPCLIYGEGDTGIIPHVLRVCQQYGSLPKIGSGDSATQLMYAGNAAQMLVLAAQKLREDPKEFGGEVFFANEQKLPVNLYDFISPYVENAGYHFSKWYLPYTLCLPASMVLEKFFGLFWYFYIQFPHNFPSSAVVRIWGAWYNHFNSTKALLMMGYKPKYETEAALSKSVAWWKQNWKDFI